MPQLEQRLIGLAEARPPRGAAALIHRIESEIGERPLRRLSPAVHPVRAMAMAAAAVFVFVGGVAVGHWAFGGAGLFDAAFGRGWTRATETDVTVLATVLAGLSGGTVLLVGALGLAGLRRRRRQAYRSSVDRGGVMDTIEKDTRQEDWKAGSARTNRWLAIGLVLALAALAGLGAWLLVDNLAKTDYEALIEDHRLAINAGDGEAVAALYTEDGVHFDGDGREYRGRDQIAAAVKILDRANFHSEITGEMVTYGSFAAFPERATLMAVTTYEGITVVEFEGGLIKRWVPYATMVFP